MVAVLSPGSPELPDFQPIVSIQKPEASAERHTLVAYKAATAGLHTYHGATVVSRTSHSEPMTSSIGTLYEELVRFEDGAVRSLTRAVPSSAHIRAETSEPLVICAGDALGTGPSGINSIILKEYVKLGFHVEWLHHQGRHTQLPVTPKRALQFSTFILKKSVGRSAHQQHGLMNDLAPSAPYDTSQVIYAGESRSAMTGEAFIALAGLHNRSVIYSDLLANCFEHMPKLHEIPRKLGSTVNEVRGAIALQQRIGVAGYSGSSLSAAKLASTFDMHPLNILNEAAWLVPLIRGDAGKYANALPLDHVGARTFLDGDEWSSTGKDWESIYAIRKGISFFRAGLRDGSRACHMDLADPYIQELRFARLARLRDIMQSSVSMLSASDRNYVIHGTTDRIAIASS